jgi:thiamine monophosphate kinase
VRTFSAAAGAVQGVADEFEREFGIRLTRVGAIEEGEGVYWLMEDGARELVQRGGYQHFGGES